MKLIDKDALLAKIDGEIKLLEPYLGACAGQIVAEANSKISTYNRVKDIINVLEVKEVQEKPVSDDFTKALAECIHQAQCSVFDPLVHAETWKDELIKLAKSEEPVSEDLEEASNEWLRPQLDKSYVNYGEVKMMELTHFDGYAMLDAIEFGAKWQKAKDESTTEDLGEYVNELSKQFPEVSFAKLSRIAVRVAKWQIEQFEKNRLEHCDSITNEQAELEQKFLDQHLDKYQRMPTFLDAIEYGMRLKEKQMIESGTDVTVHIEAGNYPYIPQIELYDYDKDIPLAKEGDKYKMILIKEE